MSNNNNFNIHSLIPIESLLKNQAYVGGRWIDSCQQFTVTNPRSLSGLAKVADLPAEQRQQVLAACRKAFAPVSQEHRYQQIGAWVDNIERCQNALTLILSQERGCSWDDAQSEVIEAISLATQQLQVASEKLIESHTISHPEINTVHLTGNADTPFMSALNDAMPLMLEGQLVVLHPDRKTPLSSLALAVIAEQSGLVAGSFNIIP
ncbi:MAG: aldehyde dehydrogenase family protein [Halopseudomonas sp.]